MADNYLERRMEELHSGKTVPRKYSKNKTHQRIFIIGSNFEAVEEKVTVYRSKHWRVAFAIVDDTRSHDSDSDILKKSTEFARMAGARFYPSATLSRSDIAIILNNLMHDWKGLDRLVAITGQNAMIHEEFEKAHSSLPYPVAHHFEDL